ncbi:MAG: hypothetical protein ABSG11_24390 [Candidatus Korobacteraceae bacterium]
MEDLKKWITLCNEALRTSDEAPYLDISNPLLDGDVPKIMAEQEYLGCAEELLTEDPSDLTLRFGLLYPLRASAMKNPCPVDASKINSDSRTNAFQHLAALCIPEQINDLRSLRFELHNSYLAGHWQLAQRLLRRMETLDLLPLGESLAVSGYLAFLGLFGRRIQYELLNDEGYDFSWNWSVPEAVWSSQNGYWAYTRPEFVKQGSPAHWIITGWCANPKAPQIIGYPPGTLDFTRPELPVMNTDGQGLFTVESVVNVIHERYRSFDALPSFQLTEEQKIRALWARRRLQDAITAAPEFAQQYRPIWARVLYAVGEFGEAAEEYEAALHERFSFDNPEDSAVCEDYEWELKFMTALCYRRAGDFERASETLESEMSSGKTTWGASWWIAKWYSEDGHYDRAADLIVKESESPLALPESWQVSTILALAKLSHVDDQIHQFVERLARTNPEMQAVIEGLSEQLWPNFALLSRQSQDYWLHAVAELHGSSLFPGAESISANTAIKDFAWIVEHELRTRIFDTFRAETSVGEAHKSAIKDSREWGDNKFFNFVTSAHPQLTFGMMVTALEECQHSVIPTHIRFLHHVLAVSPRILDSLEELRNINQQRNPAVHTDRKFKKTDVFVFARVCVKALDSLVTPDA